MRSVHLDLARAIAILMVILVHTTENIYKFNLEKIATLSAASKTFAFCSFTLGRLGVPIFLFLTGYLVLDRTFDTVRDVIEFWKKKLLPLIIAYECWTVIYEIFCSCILGQEFNLIYCLQRMAFIRGSNMSHMWYMPMIIGIYFMIPFVSVVLKRFPVKLLLVPMAVDFIYYFVCANLNTAAVAAGFPVFSNRLSLEFTGGCYGLYVLCGYMVKRLQINLNEWLLAGLTAVFFIGTVAFQVWNYSYCKVYNVFYGFGPLLLCALCLFTAIIKWKGRIILTYLWNRIAIGAAGIYFVHNMILRGIMHYDVLHLKSMAIINPEKVAVVFAVVSITSFCAVELASFCPWVARVLFLRRT